MVVAMCPLLSTIAILPCLVLVDGISLAWLMLLFAGSPSVCLCLSLPGINQVDPRRRRLSGQRDLLFS